MYLSEFAKKFIAAAAGNIVEWYDFALFGAFADIFAEVFFPPGDNFPLLKSFALFGVAFAMRPVGGSLFGWIGDFIGRKPALELSIGTMLFASFLLGCLPSFSEWGYFSTALLCVLRITQGLAAGGEMVGAYIYVIEATKGSDIGFWGGLTKASGIAGSSLGMLTSTLVRHHMTHDLLVTYGWRIAYWSGTVLGIVAVWLRFVLLENHDPSETDSLLRSVDEDEKDTSITESLPLPVSPLRVVLRQYWRNVLVLVVISSLWGVGYYTVFSWLGYYMVGNDLTLYHSPISYTWVQLSCMNVLITMIMPLSGHFADKISKFVVEEKSYFAVSVDTSEKSKQLKKVFVKRYNRLDYVFLAFASHLERSSPSQVSLYSLNLGVPMIMTVGIIVILFGTLPAFILIASGYVLYSILGLCILVLGLGLFGGLLPAYLVLAFPKSIRYSGLGLAYNISALIFFGSAPLIQTYLLGIGVQTSETLCNGLFCALYIVGVGSFALVAILFWMPPLIESPKWWQAKLGDIETFRKSDETELKSLQSKV